MPLLLPSFSCDARWEAPYTPTPRILPYLPPPHTQSNLYIGAAQAAAARQSAFITTLTIAFTVAFSLAGGGGGGERGEK